MSSVRRPAGPELEPVVFTLVPAGVARGSLAVRDSTLAALTVGPASPTGRPVVLVPGYTGSKEDFRLLLHPLARAGHHAIAIDQRGQYESPGSDDPAAYTVESLATDLLEVLAGLGPAHLVGHSFGGLVARAAVLRQPEAVRSLVLMGSGPAGLTGPRTDALVFLRPLLEQGGLHAVAAALDDLERANPPRVPVAAEVREFLRARFLAGSETALLAMADALLGEPDRVDALRDSGVPVLVLHGADDDAWTPHLQKQMADRLRARHVVVPGAQHSPALEKPAETARALLGFFADP